MIPTTTLHPARWWQTLPDGRIHCYLCPRHCHIAAGQHGFCFVRENVAGELVQRAYGRPAAVAIDPIEKKPLFHYHPGSAILSLGTAGCNLGCQFCQNFDISKARSVQQGSIHMSPEEVVELAVARGTPAIAFTYNEPTIWAEFVVDIAKLAHQAGLHTVMVSNGYITHEAFADVYPHIDAANIDLKAFTEDFYARITLSHLAPVLDMLRWLRRDTSVWFEITNLLIPGCNDAPSETSELCDWILRELGDDVPLHFTAFHPDFKMLDREPTPPETILRAREAAISAGIKYVYAGNVLTRDAGNTRCPECGKTLIRRSWHRVEDIFIDQGCCRHCGFRIAGEFD